MAHHDYGITLMNMINTRGNDIYSPAAGYNHSGYVRAEFSSLEAAELHNSTLAEADRVVRKQLQLTAAEASDYVTLSFLELAQSSTLRDAEEPLTSFFNVSVRWPDDPAPAAGADLVAELVQQTLTTSRTYFAFSGLCDSVALKGFSQWFRWRSRSDLANAMTATHYLSQRRSGFVPLPYNKTAVSLPAEPDELLEASIASEERKADLLRQMYASALAEEDTTGIGFLRSSQVRWTRTGAATDEPDWPESLLYAQARKIEDILKIRRILSRSTGQPAGIIGAATASAPAVRLTAYGGFGESWVDHQLPDTLP